MGAKFSERGKGMGKRYTEFLVGKAGFNFIEGYETLEEATEAFNDSKELIGYESGELVDNVKQKVIDSFGQE